MITIERSDLGEKLREHLFAARNCSANRECRNQLAPPGNLSRALRHWAIMPARLAKSMREALAFPNLLNEGQIRVRRSFRKELQTDVSHRVCVADNVASTSKEQIEMLAQFPCATDVERDVGMSAMLFW